MRLGIFSGTFDPPHLGHLILAEEARWQLQLDRVLWVLTPVSPFKAGQEIGTVEQRLILLKAITALDPAFEISRVEIDRPAPQYTVDTLRLLREQYEQATMIYLVGGDAVAELPRWHRPQELVAITDEIGVMRRPSDELDLKQLFKILPDLERKLRFVDAPLLEISSSDIRRRIREGKPYRFFLPEPVAEIIERLGYYHRQ